MEVVPPLLKGGDLDAASRALNAKSSSLAKVQAGFLTAGRASWVWRKPDARKEEGKRLKAKLGRLTMESELLYEQVEKLKTKLSPASRRPRR